MSSTDYLAVVGATGLAEFYGNLNQPALQDEWDSDVDLTKLIPQFKMVKETGKWTVKLGDNELHSATRLTVSLVHRVGQQALWLPNDGNESKPPLCSTGWQSVAAMKKGEVQGQFTIHEEHGQPYLTYDMDNNVIEHPVGTQVYFNCTRCPYHQFGSMKVFDPKRSESNAPACGESRTYFARPATKVASMRDAILSRNPEADVRSIDEDFGLYRYDNTLFASSGLNPHGIGMLTLSMGSNNKAVQSFVTELKAYSPDGKVPQFAAVYRLEIELETKGQTKLAHCKPKLVGIIIPDEAMHVSKEVLPWVLNFIEVNSTNKTVSQTVKGPDGVDF